MARKVLPLPLRRHSEAREHATSHYSIIQLDPDVSWHTLLLNLRWSTYFHIFYFTCALLYLIPLFMGDEFISLRDTTLASSLRTEAFACVMSAMISLSLPLLLDLGLDMANRESAHYICRSLLSLTLVLPPALSLQTQAVNQPTMFLCAFHWQHTVWTGIALSLMHKGDKSSFTPAVCLAIASLDICSAVCDILGYRFGISSLNLSYIVFDYLFFVGGGIAILRYFIALYSRQKVLFQRETFLSVVNSLPPAEYSCLVVVIASLIALTGSFILPFILSKRMLLVKDYSLPYLIGYYAISSTFAVVVTVVPSRSFKTLSKHLKANLEIKRTFVRYVGHEIRTPLNTGTAVAS